MPQKGKVSAEEKVEAVRMYESGEVSLHQAAEHAGVEETMMYAVKGECEISPR